MEMTINLLRGRQGREEGEAEDGEEEEPEGREEQRLDRLFALSGRHGDQRDTDRPLGVCLVLPFVPRVLEYLNCVIRQGKGSGATGRGTRAWNLNLEFTVLAL